MKTGKKRRFYAALIISSIILAILLTVLSNHNRVYAQATPEELIGFNPQDIPQSPEEISELGKNYLRQKWGEAFNDTYVIGPIARFYNSNKQPIDTISVFLFGVAPSLSWFYLLVVLLTFSLGLYTSRIFEFFKIISNWVKYGVSIAVAIAIAQLNVYVKLAGWIVDRISKITDQWWIQILLGLAVLFIIIYLDIISASLRNIALKSAEKAEIRKIEKREKKLEREVKKVKMTEKEREEILNALIEKEVKRREKEKGKSLTEEEIEEIEKEAEEEVQGLGEE